LLKAVPSKRGWEATQVFDVMSQQHEHFPRLFEPGMIGSMALKNRLVMAPMGTQFASDTGAVTPRMIAHYRRRAIGGVGLIIVEFTCVDYPRGKGHSSQLALHDDKLLAGHADLVQAIHESGARVSLQLHHAGSRTSRQRSENLRPVAVSPMPDLPPADQPEVLSQAQIEALIEQFARAAERARAAGYDSVEFHGSHGYLISQFLSPFENRRNDGYGGTLQNRLRFPLDVIRRTKELLGNDFPLTMRLSVREFVDGGQTVEDSQACARALEQAGLAALHVSAGGRTDPEWIVDPIYHPEGCKVHLAAKIKEAVKIPVIAVGVIRDPAYAESVIAEGAADFVALGRALLTDPDWPLKAATGRERDIHKCFSCNHCDGVRNSAGLSIRCVVNPEVGDPDWPRRSQTTAAIAKRVVVVGGGPGGMEVARIAALRGHRVTLHEQAGELGGQLLLGRNLGGKDKINWLLDDLARGLENSGAEVLLRSRVTNEVLRAMAPDVLVLASGGAPRIPNIPGVDDPRVETAWNVIAANKQTASGQVVVVGGDSTGCEVALDLARHGASVVVIEQRGELAVEMEPIARGLVRKMISTQPRLCIRLGWRAVEINKYGVGAADASGQREILAADRIVMATGVIPVRLPAVPGVDLSSECQVYAIGDCVRPGNIATALADARAVGCLV
jgi:2,4-dienoyl-CoA reductase-like NADH-dependent reductase (Old Yellow Enzyme family)/thioredoxin reductase